MTPACSITYCPHPGVRAGHCGHTACPNYWAACPQHGR